MIRPARDATRSQPPATHANIDGLVLALCVRAVESRGVRLVWPAQPAQPYVALWLSRARQVPGISRALLKALFNMLRSASLDESAVACAAALAPEASDAN